MNENQLNWYNTYVLAPQSETGLLKKIENAVQAIWDLYADKANWDIFDNEAEEEDEILFSVRTNKKGTAIRYYSNGKTTPLFQGDLYDCTLVGIADEMIADGGYELS